MKCELCQNDAKVTEINAFVRKIECTSCGTYMIEVPFIGQLEAFKIKYGEESYNKIIEEMKKQANKGNVIFVADYENTFYKDENTIYLELEDLAGLAHVKTHEINSPLSYGS